MFSLFVQSLKTTGRISSKLVGEDISKKYVENTKDIHALKNNITCTADDKSAFWPLLCYELSIGIEQEEKIIQTLDRYVHIETDTCLQPRRH